MAPPQDQALSSLELYNGVHPLAPLAAITTCRCSSYASELVCPGLLQLASNLLTTPCSCPLHVVMAARGGKAGSLPPQASPGARAVRLGLLLLQEIFEVHAEARTEVLKVAQVSAAASGVHCWLGWSLHLHVAAVE